MTHEQPLNGGSGGSRPHLSSPRSHHNRRLSPQAVALLGLVLSGSVWALHRNRSDVAAGAAAADASGAERQYNLQRVDEPPRTLRALPRSSHKASVGGGGGCAARRGLNIRTAALARHAPRPSCACTRHRAGSHFLPACLPACLSRPVAQCRLYLCLSTRSAS